MSKNPTQLDRIEINISFPMTYFCLNKQAEGPVLILLHGYADSGPLFHRRLFQSRPYAGSVLAPNAPFPVPQRTDVEWRELYSWYFRESSANMEIIPPEASVMAMEQLLKKLQLWEKEKWIIGFSQGGFFAPKLFASVPRITRFLGVGCGYRFQDYPKNPSVVVDGLHGDVDQIVNCNKSKEGHAELTRLGYAGDFNLIPSMGHTLNDHGKQFIYSWLNQGE